MNRQIYSFDDGYHNKISNSLGGTPFYFIFILSAEWSVSFKNLHQFGGEKIANLLIGA